MFCAGWLVGLLGVVTSANSQPVAFGLPSSLKAFDEDRGSAPASMLTATTLYQTRREMYNK